MKGDRVEGPAVWFQESNMDVAIVGGTKVVLHLVEERLGTVGVACDATVRIFLNSSEFDPELVLLLAEVLRTAGAMAKARTFRRKDET